MNRRHFQEWSAERQTIPGNVFRPAVLVHLEDGRTRVAGPSEPLCQLRRRLCGNLRGQPVAPRNCRWSRFLLHHIALRDRLLLAVRRFRRVLRLPPPTIYIRLNFLPVICARLLTISPYLAARLWRMRLVISGAASAPSASGSNPRRRSCRLMRAGISPGSSKSGSSTLRSPAGGGRILGGRDELRYSPVNLRRPLCHALPEQPHAIDVFVKANATADGAEVGEVRGLRLCSIARLHCNTVPTRDQVPELM